MPRREKKTAQEKWPLAFQLVAEGRAKPRVVECVNLASQGLVCRQIAAKLGIARTTVHHYLKDPLASAANERKARYRFPCSNCGELTNPGGFATAERRRAAGGLCASCAPIRNAERNSRLIELWEAGTPTAQIAAELEMTKTAVTSWVDFKRKHGAAISLRRLGGNAEEREDRRSAMIEMRAEGLSGSEIAERLGTTAASVSVMLQTARKLGRDVPPSTTGRGGKIPRDTFIRLFSAGLSPREIADLADVQVRSVYARRAHLRAAGLMS